MWCSWVGNAGDFPCWMAKMELGRVHFFRVAGERQKVEKSFRRSSRPSTAAPW